jgi:lambda repressor-like predicted transcriptional regulator
MERAEDLKFLIRAKYGSVREFSRVVGMAENTVNNHLKDGNWDRNQMVKIIRALSISRSEIYFYFFENALAKVGT